MPIEGSRDPRPPSVRSQDALILEYAVRNRLFRGPGTSADGSGVAQAPGELPGGRMRRRLPGNGYRDAARAEGIYRQIAPPGQKYPLQAVSLVRRLLREGASEEFVLGKYRLHASACEEIGVPRMPFIPYLTELLEVFLLDRKISARDGAVREHSLP